MNNLTQLIEESTIPSPITRIIMDGEEFNIKRDDQNHPILSGNKWRKLKFNLAGFSGKGIISFGGAFSNHLHALAYSCWRLNIPFIALIRGEKSFEENPTMQDIIKWGTKIEWLNRESYRKRYDQEFLKDLQTTKPNWVIIPEGGSNQSALEGVSELATEIIEQFPNLEQLVLPVGSGGTIAGLIKKLPRTVNITGISVTKENYLESMIEKWLDTKQSNWTVNRDFHLGGFGRCPEELRLFMKEMYLNYQLPLDPIYNSKAFLAFTSLIKKGLLPNDRQKTLYVHTGGLQGIKAYQYRYPELLQWYS